MCAIDGDVAQVRSRSWHRARADRRCECCDRVIREGELYEATFAVTDGSAASCSSCAQCAASIELFGQAHHYWPWPGGFIDYLRDCVRDDDGGRWVPMLQLIEARMPA